jgi:lipopolysaccharide export system permease protein
MLGKIAGKGLEIGVILEFFLLNLAWILALAVPIAVLISVLMAFGRLSGDNEITAMKASGISILSLLRPALVIGVIFAVALYYFSDRVLPEYNHRSRLLSADITRKKPTLNLQDGVFAFDVPNVVMRARKIDGITSTMKDLVIYDEGDRKYFTTILAKTGKLSYDYRNAQFVMTLYNGSIHRMERFDKSNYHKTLFDSSQFRMNAPEMLLERRESSYRSDREQSSREMLKAVAKLRQETFPNHRRIDAFMVEIHKKFSIPFACIAFMVVGVPMGIMFRARKFGISGGLAIVIFLVYWICLIGGEDLADRNYIPPWFAMWFPNILILALGMFLIIRNVRGYALVDLASLEKLLPRKWRRNEM